MKRKIFQSLPLFSTIGIIIIFGIIAFSLTPADAVMEEPKDALPVSAEAPADIAPDAISVTSTEPTNTSDVENSNVNSSAPVMAEDLSTNTTYNPTMLAVVVVGMVLLAIAAVTLIYKHKR